MKKRSIISIVTLLLTITLLITAMYSWYSSNDTASVYEVSGSTSDEKSDYIITFNLGAEKVDVPLVPGNFSELKINLSSSDTNSATLRFSTPIIGWKDIETEYTALDMVYEFEEGIYYDKDHILLMEMPEDWVTNYSNYYTVSDTVVTKEKLGTVDVNIPFERLYGSNLYYKKKEESYTKELLTLGQKREEFLKLYEAKDTTSVNMSNSIYVYVSSEKIEQEDYIDVLKDKYTKGDFGNIVDTQVDYLDLDENGSMYFYFYFDNEDLYFNTSDDIYMYGENPFFLQTITLNVMISKR